MYHFNRWLHCNKYLILSYLLSYLKVGSYSVSSNINIPNRYIVVVTLQS